GSADCKGNIAMHLEAIRLLDAAGGTRANLKVVIEGSEEFGGRDVAGVSDKDDVGGEELRRRFDEALEPAAAAELLGTLDDDL
ncbi:M20/M25/M40 family metallo-hydrolase, partial [Corynebacterium sanguinis]|nr:M20/M25/M40 family metallo-hydrolase [Corynebacterium sanguinis]